MMTPGSRHTAAKSIQRLLLARRVNFLVTANQINSHIWGVGHPSDTQNFDFGPKRSSDILFWIGLISRVSLA